jgi:integrase
MGLPNPLVDLLKQHRREQDRERALACDMWLESGYVFTTPTGRPLSPHADWAEWKRLLEKAEVPERRLHDARHTAATVLLLLGVNERAVMSVMGSSTAMAARYQHVVAAVQRAVADDVGGLLWTPPLGPAPEPGPAGDSPPEAG